MAKKFTGLDAMIAPTVEPNTSNTTQTQDVTPPKVKYVNSNVPLPEDQHIQLRIIAMERGIRLKDLLPEIISDWLRRHNKSKGSK